MSRNVWLEPTVWRLSTLSPPNPTACERTRSWMRWKAWSTRKGGWHDNWNGKITSSHSAKKSGTCRSEHAASLVPLPSLPPLPVDVSVNRVQKQRDYQPGDPAVLSHLPDLSCYDTTS